MSDTIMDFNTDGMWNTEDLVAAPAKIKGIVITQSCNISKPHSNFYTQNHMVAAVTFAEPQWFNGREYSSARLSDLRRMLWTLMGCAVAGTFLGLIYTNLDLI